MKVTFVYPDVLAHRSDWNGYFYVGVALLSSVLKRDGHRTSLIHVTRMPERQAFLDRLEEERPDLIGFSSTSHMFPLVKTMAGWIAESAMRMHAICGGIHPTIAPEEVIGVEGLDMICRGEGELSLAELCARMERGEDYGEVPNLWIKRNGRVIKNPLRPPLTEIDSLPFPDRTIFDYPRLYSERMGRGSFMVARGCPYDCSYCCNHLIRKIYSGMRKTVAFRSVDNVIAEIREVLGSYGFIRSVIFDDDILFLRRQWSEEFAEKYRSEIGLPFICNARANITDERTVELMKKAGCVHVKFGLESGNDYICNEVLNRHLTAEQVKRAFALCAGAGLTTESFNMVGVPRETPDSVLDTIKLNAAVSVDHMQVTIYQPYMGTMLADLCREEGLLGPREMESDFFSPSILKLDGITPSQILMFRDYFKILVRYYQAVGRLPSLASRLLIVLSDRVLSFNFVSKALNAVYVPLNYLFRRLQRLSTRTRAARVRASLDMETGKAIGKGGREHV